MSSRATLRSRAKWKTVTTTRHRTLAVPTLALTMTCVKASEPALNTDGAKVNLPALKTNRTTEMIPNLTPSQITTSATLTNHSDLSALTLATPAPTAKAIGTAQSSDGAMARATVRKKSKIVVMTNKTTRLMIRAPSTK